MKYILGIQTAQFPNDVCLIKTDHKPFDLVRLCSPHVAQGKQIKTDVVCTVQLKEKERTVERLGKSVNRLIRKLGLSIKDISLVAVCLGPGSYTGTRGGLAFAKGLCQFLHIPLVGVSAFEVLRENIQSRKEIENVCYILDAKNERVFYVESDKGHKEIKADSLVKILKRIREMCTFVGSGAIEYKGIIKEKLKGKAQFVELELNRLKAESVAKAALRIYKKTPSIYSKDYLYKVKPLYILPPTITKAKS